MFETRYVLKEKIQWRDNQINELELKLKLIKEAIQNSDVSDEIKIKLCFPEKLCNDTLFESLFGDVIISKNY